MPKVAVCLSGCGFMDGAEIHEAVLTLLALDRAGVAVQCCAPEMPQTRVVDHATHKEVHETRNVFAESARIARGEILPLSDVNPNEIDALVFPGGFGAALNLSSFAIDGASCTVEPSVEAIVAAMVEQGKPIAAICIAPAMLARILGKGGVKAKVTIGIDAGTAEAIEKTGVTHVDCPATDAVVDKENKIVTTPAYMLGKGPAEIFQGIEKCIDELLKMVG